MDVPSNVLGLARKAAEKQLGNTRLSPKVFDAIIFAVTQVVYGEALALAGAAAGAGQRKLGRHQAAILATMRNNGGIWFQGCGYGVEHSVQATGRVMVSFQERGFVTCSMKYVSRDPVTGVMVLHDSASDPSTGASRSVRRCLVWRLTDLGNAVVLPPPPPAKPAKPADEG